MTPQKNNGTMHVGICRLWLEMPENASLKDKRQILRSVIQRVRNRFQVSIAEVDAQNQWTKACLGIAVVSGDAQHANEVLSKVVAFIQESRLDAELFDYELDVQPF